MMPLKDASTTMKQMQETDETRISNNFDLLPLLVKPKIIKPYKKHVGSHVAVHHQQVHHDNHAFKVEYLNPHNYYHPVPQLVTPITTCPYPSLKISPIRQALCQ